MVDAGFSHIPSICTMRFGYSKRVIFYDYSVLVEKSVPKVTVWHRCVCSTVSSIMSGLETRSLGLNTLGTT